MALLPAREYYLSSLFPMTPEQLDALIGHPVRVIRDSSGTVSPMQTVPLKLADGQIWNFNLPRTERQVISAGTEGMLEEWFPPLPPPRPGLPPLQAQARIRTNDGRRIDLPLACITLIPE